MSEAIVRRDRDLGNFIPGPSLSEYGVRFESHFTLDRQDGILTIRMHRNGQAARWSRGLLNAWSLLLRDVGADRDNEVVIITGTGNSWLAGAEASSFAEPLSQWDSDLVAEQYNDGVKLLERLVFDIDVPIIAAINGPGPRLELPLMWHRQRGSHARGVAASSPRSRGADHGQASHRPTPDAWHRKQALAASPRVRPPELLRPPTPRHGHLMPVRRRS
jgi:hypothetical protein